MGHKTEHEFGERFVICNKLYELKESPVCEGCAFLNEDVESGM